MNIAQALGQENDLDENDWYFLYDQCQVLYQALVLTNMH